MGKLFKIFAVVGVLSMLLTSTALAHHEPWPSTNALNAAMANPLRPGQPAPYVEFLSAGNCEITLKFHNPASGLAFFERRIDNGPPGATPHPNPRPWIAGHGEYIYSGISVPSGTTATATYSVNSTLEIRLALGGERDWDFDWTLFTTSCSTGSGSSGSSSNQVEAVCNMVGTVPEWIPYWSTTTQISWQANWCGISIRSVDGGLWIPLRLTDKYYALIDKDGNGMWTATLAPISPAQVASGYYTLTMGTNMYKVWIGSTPPGN